LHLNDGIFLIPAIQNSLLETLAAGCGCFEHHDAEGQRRFAIAGGGFIAGKSADILPKDLSFIVA
jgi:hypothetical protein